MLSVTNGSERPDPATIIIFGATGDLTKRKLLPSLYRLYLDGRLPDRFGVVGFAWTVLSDDEFRAEMRTAMEVHSDLPVSNPEWESFEQRLFYTAGDFTDSEHYQALDELLNRIGRDHVGTHNRIYYMSVAPQFFDDIVAHLGNLGMATDGQSWRRIVVEKPFGHDLTSARALNEVVHGAFQEHQIYRIDHYLGKETVQNIMVFRFANAIFEPIWNRNYIDNVQITVSEVVGVGTRAGYYENAGVVRDMFQNHILQLLTLTAMEPPVEFEANILRDEKVKVLRALRPIRPEEVEKFAVRGQYTSGFCDGRKVTGYREEQDVAPNSHTPTYSAMKLYIDNWRWQNVPFYLRSGKRMAEKATEIVIEFKRPPHLMFSVPAGERLNTNILTICVQPDEGMHLRFETKVPGAGMTMKPVEMDFNYRDILGAEALPEAYERLILDVMQGDASLFARSDEIELAWSLIDPILQGWESDSAPPVAFYEPGSWGPHEADRFIENDGRKWYHLCAHFPE